MFFQSLAREPSETIGIGLKVSFPGLLIVQRFHDLRRTGILLFLGKSLHSFQSIFEQSSHASEIAQLELPESESPSRTHPPYFRSAAVQFSSSVSGDAAAASSTTTTNF